MEGELHKELLNVSDRSYQKSLEVGQRRGVSIEEIFVVGAHIGLQIHKAEKSKHVLVGVKSDNTTVWELTLPGKSPKEAEPQPALQGT